MTIVTRSWNSIVKLAQKLLSSTSIGNFISYPFLLQDSLTQCQTQSMPINTYQNRAKALIQKYFSMSIIVEKNWWTLIGLGINNTFFISIDPHWAMIQGVFVLILIHSLRFILHSRQYDYNTCIYLWYLLCVLVSLPSVPWPQYINVCLKCIYLWYLLCVLVSLPSVPWPKCIYLSV